MPRYEHNLLAFTNVDIEVPKSKTLSFISLLSFSKQIGNQIKTMHDNSDVHFDLKPENIMYRSHAGQDEFKIIDYGLTFSADGRPPPWLLWVSPVSRYPGF